jgi:hypothetical protein
MSIRRSQSQIGQGFYVLLAVLTLLAASGFSQPQSRSSHSIVGSRQDLGPEDLSNRSQLRCGFTSVTKMPLML